MHVQRKKKAKEISTVCTVCKHVFTGKYAVYELRKHICDASAKDEQLVVRRYIMTVYKLLTLESLHNLFSKNIKAIIMMKMLKPSSVKQIKRVIGIS